jgi:hypothetical protein
MKKPLPAIGSMDFEIDISNHINDLGYQFCLVLRDPANGAVSYYTNVRSKGLGKIMIAKAIEGQTSATIPDGDQSDESSNSDEQEP